MTVQTYALRTPRIGKLKGEILKHAVPVEVLGITGQNHKIGKNQSDTVIYRRWLPYGGATTNSTTINQWVVDANAHLTQDGVTPDADTLTPQDITVQIHQYSCLYMYTDKTAELYEDNIPDPMKKQTGQRMGLVREMIRYGALKGCTNKFYAGGTSRATVDEAISLSGLRSITRSIAGNRGKMITEILSPSPNFNTSAVEAGYLVFCHTDMENDVRELPGFIACADYGSRKVMHEMELGSVDRFRFICSPELSSIADSGAAVGTTGLLSTSASNIDVYPNIVVAEDAWGDVALRGMDSFNITHIPHGKKDKSDPLGQRGYIGASFWSAAFVQNDGWMAVYETGATDL
jgi:N4-gp56 family major capsid protein